jgi:DNA-directed RNA polymerase specialized sigma subunit
MPVLTHEEILEALEKCPTVKYPKKVLKRLDREYAEAKAQMARGELKPMTVEEIAAEYGITLDDED